MTASDKKDSQNLFQIFALEMNDLGGNANFVNVEEIPEQLKTILSGNISEMPRVEKKLVIYQSPLVDKVISRSAFAEMDDLSIHWLPMVRPQNFDPEAYRQIMANTDAAIVAADYLIANSGTIVLLEEHHRSQMSSLLPPTLIVLASEAKIVNDMHALFEMLNDRKRPSEEVADLSGVFDSSLHFITGSSRTADIEKTLILGVHGPENLHVLVIS